MHQGVPVCIRMSLSGQDAWGQMQGGQRVRDAGFSWKAMIFREAACVPVGVWDGALQCCFVFCAQGFFAFCAAWGRGVGQATAAGLFWLEDGCVGASVWS